MKRIISGIIIGIFAIFLIILGSRYIITAHPDRVVTQLLAKADITINGDHPWDIMVHNDQLYARVLGQGSIGLGESYMDGWWDVP